MLVIIDDMDRLAPDEALTIFQLIKSVGRFPNIIYLLAYDRDLMKKAVAHRYPSEGDHYLEKIVQAGFDLPVPNSSRLLETCEARIRTIFATKNEDRFKKTLHIVETEFRTPRDIPRFCNILAVTYPVCGEVDPADFMAMEALRFFRPSVYHTIRLHKLALTGLTRFDVRENEEEINKTAEFDKLFLRSEPEADWSNLKTWLAHLFPSLNQAWFTRDSYDTGKWQRERRVCCNAHFDTYFLFSFSSDVIPKAEIQKIINQADDQNFIQETVHKALEKPWNDEQTKAFLLINELALRAQDVADAKASSFLKTMYGVAGALQTVADDDPRRFFYPGDGDGWRLYQLTRRLLIERISSAEQYPIIKAALQSTPLDFSVYVITQVRHEHYPPQGNHQTLPGQCLLTKQDLQTLQQIVLSWIRQAAVDGSLLKVRYLGFVLLQWKNLSPRDVNDIKIFWDKLLTDDQSVIQTVRAFLGKSYVSRGGNLSTKDLSLIEEIKNLVDIKLFRNRLHAMRHGSQLNLEDAKIVQRFLAVSAVEGSNS